MTLPKSIVLLIALLITASLIFILFPQLDILISALFFDEESQKFPLRKALVPMIFYKSIYVFSYSTGIWCFGGLIFRKLKPLKTPKWLPSNRHICFMLICMIIGPGLIVHQGFKSNFGRTRPVNITEFNGSQIYSAAYEVSNNGGKSFISGHSAMGFFACAYAFLFTGFMRCKIYISGLIFGGIVASMRMMQGAHFFSDVAIAALITLLVIHTAKHIIFKKEIT